MFGWNKKRGASFEARGASFVSSLKSFLNSRLAPRAARLPRSRRGVLLLVVLSVLVLFLMIGTAFIIVAKQSEKAAKTATAATIKETNAAARGNLLNDVVLQIVRDTDNPLSVLRTHSLLNDLYGNDGFRGRITNVRWAASPGAAAGANNPTGSQMLQFELDTTADFNSAMNGAQYVVDYYSQPFALSQIDDAYAGQVITFTSGGAGASARGVSVRIVGYSWLGGNSPTFTVMAFPLANGSLIDDPNNPSDGPALLNNSSILVNGRPFNGTGAGYDPTLGVTAAYEGPKLIAKEQIAGPNGNQSLEIALLPNPVYFDPTKVLLTNPNVGIPVTTYFADPLLTDMQGRGGADESYDAPDFQNMLLALQQDEPEDAQNPYRGTLENLVLPSLHRPELINYWANRVQTAGSGSLASPTNAALLRKVLLRPNHLDHPNFTGSNAQYENTLRSYLQNPQDAQAQLNMLGAYIFGPWDVDNDNDGNRDSVWVDVGLPVIMGPHGRLVKPLAAILCVDLDGRINVNTAGTVDLAGISQEPQEIRLNDDDETDDVPKGIGWGVAEITAKAAVGEQSAAKLLRGFRANGNLLPGRYGHDELFPGRGQSYDAMAQITHSEFPQHGNQQPRTAFASPPDLRARYCYAVNQFGQLVLQATMSSERNTPAGSLAADSPYEATLLTEGSDGDFGNPTIPSGPQQLDAPFSLAELERILRAYDTDATALPSRLAVLSEVFSPQSPYNPSGMDQQSARQRNRITTDSQSIPTPHVELPHEMESLLAPPSATNPATGLPYRRRPQSTAELVEMRVRAALAANPPQGLNAQDFPAFPVPLTNPQALTRVREVMRQILAPELAAGGRLNVNRPLGNGRDDNGNDVVDEPGEDLASNQTWMWQNPSAAIAQAELLDQNFNNAKFTPLDADGDGVVDDADAMQQRQLMARHLYVLALTLTAPGDWGAGAPSADDQAMARRLAQWAVNAVDYRDADNIMTPFEYDLNPFDGWKCDGDLKTFNDRDGTPWTYDDTYVMGAERPELLMTEVLAWHDRQTEDETGVTGGVTGEDPYPSSDKPGYTNPDAEDFDPDYDQLVRPRGALFIELYHPYAAEPGAGGDTHRLVRSGGQGGSAADLGVDLTKVDAATGNSPVWRMVIYKRGSLPIAQAALWDPNARRNDPNWRRPDVAADRSIYFTPFDPAQPDRNGTRWDEDGVAFFPNPDRDTFDGANDPRSPSRGFPNVGTVRPGRYLVVGSGEIYDTPGVYKNPIGDPTIPLSPSHRPTPRRRIELNTANVPERIRMVDESGVAFVDPQTSYAVQTPGEGGGGNYRPAPLAGDNSASVADVAIIDHVWDYADGDTRAPRISQPDLRRRRLTLSEPAHGYVYRFGNAVWGVKPNAPRNASLNGQKLYYTNPESGQPLAIDIPLDGPIAPQGTTSRQVLLNRVDDQGNPVFNDTYPIPYYLQNIDEALCKVGPIDPTASTNGANVDPRMSYAFIYLQRLANPLLPWNPLPDPQNPNNGYNASLEINPYVTIDCMSSDITVFNGNQRNTADKHQYSQPGFEEDKDSTVPGREYGTDTNLTAPTFASLQRGFSGRPGNARQGQTNNNTKPTRLWDIQRPTSTASQNAARNGAEALTPLNEYQRLRATRQVFKTVPFSTLGFLNAPFQDAGNPQKQGSAIQLSPRADIPLSWYPWNNRPYVSGNELLLVPRVSGLQMLRQFTTNERVQNDDLYDDPVVDILPAARRQGGVNPAQQQDLTPFTHLENFFYDKERNAGGGQGGQLQAQPSHLYRMLEYVQTPSLFPGAGKWLNPGIFGGPPAVLGDPRYNRMPPFNWVSEFREPGRINLNSIASPAVYAGLFHSDEDDADDVRPQGNNQTHPGPQWDDFLQSRRGYSVTGDAEDHILALDNSYPTFFVNPFRSSEAATLVPLPSMVQTEDDNGAAEVRGVETTLFRSDNPAANNVGGDRLFAAGGDDNDVPKSYADWKRTAFYRYAPMTRLDNLVTNQSNVYAVWITIGFFEVEEIPADSPIWQNYGGQNDAAQVRANFPEFSKAYPDGYTYGKEDGLEEGDVRRLRGFYIIDRSRPVGFEPGVDNNVENAIRLHRRIE
jgi:hypothetical protein